MRTRTACRKRGTEVRITHAKFLCLAVITVSFMAITSARAQEVCTDVGSSDGERVLGSIVKSDASCEVTEGMWVKTSTSYYLHAYAEAYGGCQFHAWDCQPGLACVCVSTGDEARGVAGVHIMETNSNPMSPFHLGSIFAIVDQEYPHQIDSHWPGSTSGPVSWSPYTPGTSTLEWTGGCPGLC